MNYKIEGAIKRNKKNFIIYIILWLLLAIVFVPSIANSIGMAKQSGNNWLSVGMETFIQSIINPFGAIGNIFAIGATGDFFVILIIVSIIYSIFFFIGFVKSAPKNEYTDIEHGSSDWSQKGEQYQILTKNKGIILAENNYLPVDKRGNVNVLVVGRIWIR